MTKERYFESFLKRRLPKVLIPFMIAIVLYWGYYALCGEIYSPLYVLKSFFSEAPFVSHSWFIIAILLFYLVYWTGMALQKRLVPGRGKNAFLIGFLTVFVLIWMVVCLKRGFGSHWGTTIQALVIGVTWAAFEKKLAGLFRRFWFPMAVLCWGAFLAINIFWASMVKYIHFHPVAILRTVETSVYVLGMLLITMKVKFGNRVLRFLGKISLEFYLIHGLITNLLTLLGMPPIPLLFAALALSTVAAYLFHLLDEAILSRLGLGSGPKTGGRQDARLTERT